MRDGVADLLEKRQLRRFILPVDLFLGKTFYLEKAHFSCFLKNLSSPDAIVFRTSGLIIIL